MPKKEHRRKMWCLIDRKTGEIEPVGVLASLYSSTAYVVGFETEASLLRAVDPLSDEFETREIEFKY